jgi:hypothetical protein
MSKGKKPDLIVSSVREYESNGEKRKFFTKVGVGYVSEKGCWISIDPNISVTGTLYCGPPKTEAAQGDDYGDNGAAAGSDGYPH